MSDASRYLTFTLGSEHFAVQLLTVKEVIAIPEITPIPFAPAYFLGIMNLRGQVISVIDLRKKFGIKPQPSEETGVIICDIGGTNLGVVVDSIDLVVTPKDQDISEKPAMHESKASEFITGVFRQDSGLVLMIDMVRTLSSDDQKVVNKVQNNSNNKAA